MGIKWEFHRESPASHLPALGASLYIEFPTGDSHKQLGSGLTDYWLNLISQKSFTDKTRMNINFGYLFAGNTSTGVLGIQTTRGHVYTGGLSLLHDFTPRLTLGAELYGGYHRQSGLGRSQFQALDWWPYAIRYGMAITFGLLGGSYIASPRIGGQIGFAVDFPDLIRPLRAAPASFTKHQI